MYTNRSHSTIISAHLPSSPKSHTYHDSNGSDSTTLVSCLVKKRDKDIKNDNTMNAEVASKAEVSDHDDYVLNLLYKLS
jgi:hypothetical protein